MKTFVIWSTCGHPGTASTRSTKAMHAQSSLDDLDTCPSSQAIGPAPWGGGGELALWHKPLGPSPWP
eukprot:195974-Chlamydomonas_euryale.AAC.1